MALTEYVKMPGADYQKMCDMLRLKSGKTDLIKSGDFEAEIGDLKIGKVAHGTVTGTGAAMVINHDLGATPDIIIVHSNGTTSMALKNVTCIDHAIGFSSKLWALSNFAALGKLYTPVSNTSMTGETLWRTTETSCINFTSDTLPVHTADSSTFRLGNGYCVPAKITYSWCALSIS